MRFISSVILTGLLAALAEYALPWWSVAVVCFVVSLLVMQKPGKAFLMGFLAIGLFWFTDAVFTDSANDHILSARMAALFHLPNGSMFIVVSAVVGGLVGGLAAYSAALFRKPAKQR